MDLNNIFGIPSGNFGDPSSWMDPGNLYPGVGPALGIGSGDPSNPYRQGAAGLAGVAGQQYQNQMARAGATEDYLGSVMRGQNSASAEQLRQGLQQQLAQQRSMAASANPNDASMAARNAAMNMGQASYGMAGQQALAGIQERNAAAQALGGLQGTLAGQSLSGAGGLYGAVLGNPQKTLGSLLGGGVGGLAGGAAAAMSDRNAKTNIADGAREADHVLARLPKAYTYKYKDQQYGKGKRLGIMAQDLERAGLKHAVIDTPRGKMVDGAQLSTANTALLSALAKRVGKLERKR